MSQLVDVEAAKEFMKETLEMVAPEILIAIASDLEVKSGLFKTMLQKDKIMNLSDEELTHVLDQIFSIRRKVDKVYKVVSPQDLKTYIFNLLYDNKEIKERFQDFHDNLGELETGLKCDVAGEILHFTMPDKYWLWGRWMWDPKVKTGAIPLLTTDDFDMEASTEGDMYMMVGKGVAFIHSIAEAVEFQFISRSLFGTDVYMSCVYVIYAYTVLRMRMTQEFNKVMPNLSEFSRRLLGVLKVKMAA